MDFFDNAFTFSNYSSNVTCCRPDGTFELATCGQGVSCTSQCSALEASFCPSGECTNDPRTCKLSLESADDQPMARGGSIATYAGTDLAWCTSDGCRVRKHRGCCYNPNCLKWKGRKEACAWLDYLTGIKNQNMKICS